MIKVKVGLADPIKKRSQVSSFSSSIFFRFELQKLDYDEGTNFKKVENVKKNKHNNRLLQK